MNKTCYIFGAGDYTGTKVDFDNVKIFSLNNDFYDAIGLTPTDEACEVAAYYELPANKYDTFLKNIEEKYDIKKA